MTQHIPEVWESKDSRCVALSQFSGFVLQVYKSYLKILHKTKLFVIFPSLNNYCI